MNIVIERSAISRILYLILTTIIVMSCLIACQNTATPLNKTYASPSSVRISSPTHDTLAARTKESADIAILELSSPTPPHPPATVTAKPTSTPQPEPTATATITPSPSPTPIGLCEGRNPSDDGLALVTLDYGISRKYAPTDLVNLSDYLPVTVTLGFPSQVREIVIEPLNHMINDMLKADLHPQVVSGYRSYASQAIAWNKWVEAVPDRASIVSAPPGHSEHQLGTTIDFGSPELALIVDDDDVRFHTYFFKTSEGQWLADNAHNYGFTLSFTRETFEVSGLYYEPWHFRYVGPDLAIYLRESNITLIQYLLDKHGPPCNID